MQSPFRTLTDTARLVLLALFVLVAAGVAIFLVAQIAIIRINALRPLEIKGTGILDLTPLWDYESPDHVIGSPLADERRVYVRTSEGIRILDRITGKQLETVSIPGNFVETRPPMIYADMMFIPRRDSQLTAYKLDSMSPLWTACPPNTNCEPPAGYSPIGDITYSEEGVLVVTRYGGDMTAYITTTGITLWEKHFGGHSYPFVVATTDTLYASEPEGLNAYDIRSGTLRWTVPLYIAARLMINRDTLYAVTSTVNTNTHIVALELSTKRILWDLPVSTSRPTDFTHLALSENALIVASDSLSAVDMTSGTVLWENDSVRSLERPLINGATLLVRNYGSDLFAFDVTTGKLIGQLSLQNNPAQTMETELNPVIYDNMLIVPMGATHIVAFELK